MPIPVPATPPAIPWYKSQVLWGLLISVILKAIALLYPKISVSAEETKAWVELVTLLASFIGDAVAAHGRISATAQPVTLTQSGADETSAEIRRNGL